MRRISEALISAPERLLRAGLHLTGRAVSLVLFTSAALSAGATERIVVADGALTEILYELGAEHLIAGVDTTSTYPSAVEDHPNVGYLRALSAEGVLSLEPDLLLTTQDAGPPAVLHQLREAGLTIEQLEVEYSAAGTAALIEQVGRIIDLEDDARELARSLERDIARQQGRIDPDTRIMFLLRASGRGLMVSGSGTRAHALIELVGADNPFADLEGYKPLTNEAAMAAAPDVILVSHVEGDVSSLYENAALRMTPAAQAGQIHSVDDTRWLQFGPQLDRAVAELSDMLLAPQSASAAGRGSHEP